MTPLVREEERYRRALRQQAQSRLLCRPSTCRVCGRTYYENRGTAVIGTRTTASICSQTCANVGVPR